MFNWICPQCGSDVLASYSECPVCAKAAAQPGAQPQPVAAQAPPQAAAPPVSREPVRSAMFSAPPVSQQPAAPAAASPQQPQYAPPQHYYAPPPQRSGMPTWLMSILFAAGFVLLGGGVYWLINHNNGGATPAAASSGTSAPGPAAASGAPAKTNPMQKFIEVTGVRLFQNSKKQVEAKFLIVNHSEAEMTDLGGTVEIRARTAKEGETPVGSFKFKIGSIGPNDMKEAAAIVNTKLKVYELPDWQLTDTRVQITSP